MIRGYSAINLISAPRFFGFAQALIYNVSGSDFTPSSFHLIAYSYDLSIGNSLPVGLEDIRNKTKLYANRSGVFTGGNGVAVTSSTPSNNAAYTNVVSTISSGILGKNTNNEYYTTSELYNIAGRDNSQDMGEILVYNKVLEDTEISSINGYLMTKWSIGSMADIGTGTGFDTGTGTGTGTDGGGGGGGGGGGVPTSLQFNLSASDEVTGSWTPSGGITADYYDIYLYESSDSIEYSLYNNFQEYYDTFTAGGLNTNYYYYYVVVATYGLDSYTSVDSPVVGVFT